MKKHLVMLAALLLCAALLTGCAQTTRTETPAAADAAGFQPKLDINGEATIEVRGSWANFEALDAVALDWNKVYPNVQINYLRLNDYAQNLSLTLQSENRPDIIMFDPAGYYDDRESVVAALADLSSLELDLDQVTKGARNAMMVDGQMKVLNWGLQATGFAVNLTMLNELGLSMPVTRTDLEKVCAALSSRGYIPIQGCYINIYSLLTVNDRDARIAAEEDQEALYNRFANAEEGCGEFFRQDFETLLSFLRKGYINPEANKAIEEIYETTILRFFEGDVPFMCLKSETVSGMKKRETKSETFAAHPFEYTFVSLPMEGDRNKLSVSTVQGLSLVSGSAQEAWAQEFLRFVSQPVELSKMASIKGVPSVVRNDDSDSRYASLKDIPAEDRVNSSDYPVLQLIEEPFNAAMWAIAEGEATTAEEAEAVFEQWLRDKQAVQQ